jgi:hypothetical protein
METIIPINIARGVDFSRDGTGKRETPVAETQEKIWLPPRDSNPDNLLQRQVSYH